MPKSTTRSGRPEDVYQSRDSSVVEADIAWEGSVEQTRQFILADPRTQWSPRDSMAFPSLDMLYMLKMSHRYLKTVPFPKLMEISAQCEGPGQFFGRSIGVTMSNE
jgi:hypothetical protein